MLSKTYKTALCVLPPRAVWAPLQELRLFRDKSYVRWPPHINLIYPFIEPSDFPMATDKCRQALHDFDSFQIKLTKFGYFEHPNSCTLWLQPEANELLSVQHALQAAFPHHSDLSQDRQRDISKFRPHLSVGQYRTSAEVSAAAEQYGSQWQPLSFTVDGVALLSRQSFGGPFHLAAWIPFGGKDPVQLNTPYLATVGNHTELATSSAAPEALAERLLGIGAAQADGSLWYFAFGANMAPRKLHTRSLNPLESVPARLPGWRLSFSHRGGMGNVVRQEGGTVHGVLHRLRPADYAQLLLCEHEYRPVEVVVETYAGRHAVCAVAMVTPDNCRIQEGLPPISRYLTLLQEGARHWQLDEAYCSWLECLPAIDAKQRDNRYYTSTAGDALPALPKIRTGSQPQRRQGRHAGQGRPVQGGRRATDS